MVCSLEELHILSKGEIIMDDFLLSYLEIKITEHCNLNCSVCCDFGNIAEADEYGVETYEKDMKRLVQLGVKIKKIRLLGGEPLLSKHVATYIKLTRTYQPEADIHLVTNGMLLRKMPQDFFEIVRGNDITVQISNYPEEKNQPYIAEGRQRLEDEGVVNFEYKPVCFEIDYTFEDNLEDVEKIFKRCNLIYNSTNLYRGRIYKCPRPISLRHYDKKYGTALSDMSDGIDLFEQGMTSTIIEQRLEEPIRSCRYCTLYRGYVEWGQSAPNPNYWINTPDNDLLIDNYEPGSRKMYDALNKFEYLIIENIEGNLSFRKIQMGEIMDYPDHSFNLWLIDKYSIERFHFFKRLIKRLNRNITGYIMDNEDFLCWLDEQEQQSLIDKKRLGIFRNR